MMPLAYLLTGGVSMRSLMPSWSYQWVRSMEKLIPGVDGKCGMFAFIVLDRL